MSKNFLNSAEYDSLFKDDVNEFETLDVVKEKDGYYSVSYMFIDIAEYSKEEIEYHLKACGYGSLEGLLKRNRDLARQIVVDCIAKNSFNKSKKQFNNFTDIINWINSIGKELISA